MFTASTLRRSLIIWSSAIVLAFVGRLMLLAALPTVTEATAWGLAAFGPLSIGFMLSRPEAAPVSRLLYDLEHPDESGRDLRKKLDRLVR
jgi:hypothetical protein